MTAGNALKRGREAFERKSWADAYAQFSAVDREASLEPEDLERFATAAYLLGEDAESADAWARAHHGFLARGDTERGARCAFWLGFGLLQKGESARAGGWLARADRLLEVLERDCVEEGYLLLPVALRAVIGGDNAAAHAAFERAGEIGERFEDADPVAFARHGKGRTLIRLGEVAEGVRLLDEAMVAVEAGELSPMVAGDVYCSLDPPIRLFLLPVYDSISPGTQTMTRAAMGWDERCTRDSEDRWPSTRSGLLLRAGRHRGAWHGPAVR